MHRIDLCAHTNRWAYQHPCQKLLLAGGTLLLSLLLPPLATGPLILAGMVCLALLGARVPAGIYLRFLALGMAFALMGAIPLAFSVGWGRAGMELAFSATGAETALKVLFRAWAAMSCLLFLAMTTPLTALVGELRRLKVPGAVIEVMQLIYRMLWLLTDVCEKVRVAQTARLGYCGLRQSFRSTGMLAGSLFWRTMDRAQRMENGLAARGYQGSLNVLVENRPLSINGVVITLAFQALLIVVSFILVEVFPCLK
jgi:cobalt/nickel transport system permease protein